MKLRCALFLPTTTPQVLSALDDAWTDGSLPALLKAPERRTLSLDDERPLLFFVDDSPSTATSIVDVIVDAARWTSTMLDTRVVGVAHSNTDVVVVDVDPHVDNAPPSVWRASSGVALSPTNDAHHQNRDAMARAQAEPVGLIDEVVERMLDALGLDHLLLAGGMRARVRGTVPARLFPTTTDHRDEQFRIWAPHVLTATAGQTIRMVVDVRGARPPLVGRCVALGALSLDVVRLAGDDGEETVAIEDGRFFLPARLLSSGAPAKLIIEGVARAPGAASIAASFDLAHVVTDVFVRQPPRPFSWAPSRSDALPFLHRREGGHFVALFSMAHHRAAHNVDVIIHSILARTEHPLAIHLVERNDAGEVRRAEIPLSPDDAHAVLATQPRLEVRARTDRGRTQCGFVVARDHPDHVVVAVMHRAGTAPLVTDDDAVRWLQRGIVSDVVIADWEWDIFAAPHTTPYESISAIVDAGAALIQRRRAADSKEGATNDDVERQNPGFRGVGRLVGSRNDARMRALVAHGATTSDAAAWVQVSADGISTLERQILASNAESRPSPPPASTPPRH